MARIQFSNGKWKRVKNLSWFAKHTKHIVYCEFHEFDSWMARDLVLDGLFRAWTDNGTMFEAEFASLPTLQVYLNRCPNLLGVEFSVYTGLYSIRTDTVIGKDRFDGPCNTRWYNHKFYYSLRAKDIRRRVYGIIEN